MWGNRTRDEIKKKVCVAVAAAAGAGVRQERRAGCWRSSRCCSEGAASESRRERERQTEQGSRSRLAAHVSSVSCRRRRSSPPLLLSNSSSLIGGRRLSPSLAPSLSLSHSCFARKPVPCLGFRHTCSLRTASALDTITESAADKRDTRSSQQEPGRGPRDDRGSVYGPVDGGRRQDSRRREAHLWSSSSSRVDDK